MDSSTANPIYDRLTRGSRWPSRSVEAAIGAATGVAGFCIGLAMIVTDVQFAVYAAALILGVSLPVIYLVVNIILAALLAARFAEHEQLALIRISGLPGQQIVAGLTVGIRHNLWGARVIGLWLPGGLIGSALFFDAFVAIPFVVIIILIFYYIGLLMSALGMWIGLRWPHHALAYASLAAVAWWIVAAGSMAGVVSLLLGDNGLLCFLALTVEIVLFVRLARFCPRDMARVFDRPAGS